MTREFLERFAALRLARQTFTEHAAAITMDHQPADIEAMIGQTVSLVLDVLDLVEQTPAEDQLRARLHELGGRSSALDRG